MAIEPTLEEAWTHWYNSGDSRLVRLADELAPHLSINEEVFQALLHKDHDKILYIGEVMRPYDGPNECNSIDPVAALKALDEIRSYQPPSQ